MINITNRKTQAVTTTGTPVRKTVNAMSVSNLTTAALTPNKNGNSQITGSNYSQNNPYSSNQYTANRNYQQTAVPSQSSYPGNTSSVSSPRSSVLQAAVNSSAYSAPAVRTVSRPPLPPAQKLLKKGEKYSITKNHPSSLQLTAGIGWDFSGQIQCDVDIEAFMLNDTEKVPDDSWIVFYGQLRSPDGAVIHRGDSSSGAASGPDCEQIDINLNGINKQISKIALVMTINEAKLHSYNFSILKNAYIRFSDKNTGKELFRYELNDYYREVVSMVVGELYFRNNEWRFNPVGMGTGDDLEGLCNRYGIEVR